MKTQTLNLLFGLIAITLLSGCSTTTKIRYLEPASVEEVSLLKQVSVEPFKNDNVGLSAKIESKLSLKKFNGKHYFTVVSRQEMNKILKEQKRQYSGLTNGKKSVELGELVGAQAFIAGEVTHKGYSDHNYYEKRIECADSKCKTVNTYNVRCRKRNISLSANIKIISVENGQIVYTYSDQKSNHFRTCTDRSTTLPSPSNIWQKQAGYIASNFVEKISPSYSYRQIELLDKAEDNYTNQQKKLLEGGIEYVKANRIEKADKLFSKLVFESHSKSYVAYYNLGVVKEAQGDYVQAKQLFSLADNLLTSPNEAVDKAIHRINSVIKKQQKALKQIGQ